MRLLLILSLSLLLTTCGQGDFEKHQAGTVSLWLTDSQLIVESECRKRGVDVYLANKVYGCCDFMAATIISTKDFRVLSHELCHWTLATYSHDKCPILF